MKRDEQQSKNFLKRLIGRFFSPIISMAKKKKIKGKNAIEVTMVKKLNKLKSLEHKYKNLGKLFLMIWIFTIAAFFLLPTVLWTGQQYLSESQSLIVSLDIILGVIAFILLVIFSTVAHTYRFRAKRIQKKSLTIKKEIKKIPGLGIMKEKNHLNLSFTIIFLLLISLLWKSFSQPMNMLGNKSNISTPIQTKPQNTIRSSIPTPIPTANPDPIVSCQFKHTPVRQMKSSECRRSTECQLVQGGDWFFFPTVEDCKKAQEEYKVAQRQTQPPNTGPSYNLQPTVTCVLSYGTFQLTQSYCDSLKATDTQRSTVEEPILQEPTPTDEELLAIYELQLQEQQRQEEERQQQINQCKNEVNSYYNQQVQNCYIQYGGYSSAGPACERIMNEERGRALKKCED